MAMNTEWVVAFPIHNIALASTKFEVFIKISSDWIIELMGRTVSHFSSPLSSFRHAYRNRGRVKGRQRI